VTEHSTTIPLPFLIPIVGWGVALLFTVGVAWTRARVALEFQSFFHRLSFQLITIWPTPARPMTMATIPTAKSIASQVTAGVRTSNNAGGTPVAASAAAAASAGTARLASSSTSSAPSAISQMFGSSCGGGDGDGGGGSGSSGYTVSERTVKERSLAKVLYENDALLTIVKSAAAATTSTDPVLKLPAQQAVLVKNSITAELSQIAASNFFAAEASRGAQAGGLPTTNYYEHHFPFALVYSRLKDIQKLRVILGSEMLVDAWSHDFGAVGGRFERYSRSGPLTTMETTMEPEGPGMASRDPAPYHIAGCSEYLDVLANEHYPNTNDGSRVDDDDDEGEGADTASPSTAKASMPLPTDTNNGAAVPITGVVKLMLPFPPWTQSIN